MSQKKSNAGRPRKEKDENAKQMNVMVPGYLTKDDLFHDKIKYQSFSQYVLGLIRNDLTLSK